MRHIGKVPETAGNVLARTIAQDDVSCVVFGMPNEAIARGAVEAVVPLRRIAETALSMSDRFA